MQVLSCNQVYVLIILTLITSCSFIFLCPVSGIVDLGVLLWFVSNIYLARCLLHDVNRFLGKQLLLKFYRSEFIKLLLIGTSCVLMQRFFQVNILEILLGYVVTQIIFCCLWLGWGYYVRCTK